MRNFLILGLLIPAAALGQTPTVGTLAFVPDSVSPGYTLYQPHNQPDAFLINFCGEVVHRWEAADTLRPGNSAYLLPNGDLVRALRPAVTAGNPIWAGGGGATIERVTWDGTPVWSFTLNSATERLHHDFVPIPGGNVLALVWEAVGCAAAVAAGRLPELVGAGGPWPEKIIEIAPDGTGGAHRGASAREHREFMDVSQIRRRRRKCHGRLDGVRDRRACETDRGVDDDRDDHRQDPEPQVHGARVGSVPTVEPRNHRHDRHRGQEKCQTGDDQPAATCATRADVHRQLGGVRAGDQVRRGGEAEKLAVVHPLTCRDELVAHHRHVCRRTSEPEHTESQEHASQLGRPASPTLLVIVAGSRHGALPRGTLAR